MISMKAFSSPFVMNVAHAQRWHIHWPQQKEKKRRNNRPLLTMWNQPFLVS